METYNPRNIEFKGVHSVKNWEIKTYSIVYEKKSFAMELEKESLKLLQSDLPEIDDNTHGLGFMIMHHGKGSNFVLLDWWCNKNELKQQVYYSSKGAPGILRKQNGVASIACVWDLIIINHERNAWVLNMMSEQPNKINYLKNYIHGKF